MKVSLTKKESLLIYHAAWLIEGFLDFENYNDDEFLVRYGLTKSEASETAVSLRNKFYECHKLFKK